ncbi:SPOR domain-containing protein [Siccirubricoccus sp. G192]|uniref:SPOR domain-containing protein n=1 Tax=Siccirubricoccus sp. G192 TaxID=2849651 RepID=UPI001C2CAAF3|nr:SPOR domain-containing protein [Siccirubricoccus sp. G192]MBV1798429.1 SPOR domain-containing protein [Siccirubricoccus sp. G192]
MSGRMLVVAGGLLGVAALGGAVAWGISRMGPRPVPVIEADSRPLKIRPENPGGLLVPNQDQLVLEPPSVRRAAERSQSATARLDAGPEMPALDVLRQQAAPPAPAVVAPPAAPLPAPVAFAPEEPAVPPTAPAQPAPRLAQAVPAQPAAAPAAVEPAAPALQPVAGGRQQIQLGALSSEAAAKTEWERLQRRVPELAGFQPRITRLEREGQATLYRLRTGGLADQAAARALCEAVRDKGGNCAVLGS